MLVCDCGGGTVVSSLSSFHIYILEDSIIIECTGVGSHYLHSQGSESTDRVR